MQRIGGKNSYADLGVGGIELLSEKLASNEGVVDLAYEIVLHRIELALENSGVLLGNKE